MRISYLSSYVCSSDLLEALDQLLRLQFRCGLGELLADILALLLEIDRAQQVTDRLGADLGDEGVIAVFVLGVIELFLGQPVELLERRQARQIGSASCRERVCQYV